MGVNKNRRRPLNRVQRRARYFTPLRGEVLESRLALSVTLKATDLAGNLIDVLPPSGNFILRATVPGGVYAAYVDVTFDPSVVSVDGPITHGPQYANFPSGDTSTPGSLDEVGSFFTCPPSPSPCIPLTGEFVLLYLFTATLG